MSEQYPEDEFDVVGEDMPVGMHRPRPSRWKAVWPFLLILLIVPALGWGASSLLTSRGVIADSTQSEAQSAASVTAQETQSAAQSEATAEAETPAAAETESTTEPEPAETTEPAVEEQPAEADLSTPVRVLNASGVNGLAASQSAVLTDAGFTSVEASNAEGWAAQTAIVYVADESQEPTAKKIMELLGISSFQVTSDVPAGEIVVLVF